MKKAIFYFMALVIAAAFMLLSQSSRKPYVKTTYKIAVGQNPASSYTLNPGDSLLFERGGSWTITSRIVVSCLGNATDSVYIGAYTGTHGTAKPTITNRTSLPSWNDPARWAAYRGDSVWRYTFADNRNLTQSYRIWLNGAEATRAYMDYISGAVRDSVNRFERVTNNVTYDLKGIIVYSAGGVNPASSYTNIEWTGGTSDVLEIDYDYFILEGLDIRGGSGATVDCIYATNFSVRNNVIGIDATHTGINFNGAKNGDIAYNEIESGDRIKHKHLYQYGVGDGILFSIGMHDVNIHNNYIHDWGHSCYEILTLSHPTIVSQHYKNGYLISNINFYDNLCKAVNVDYCRGFALDVDTSIANRLVLKNTVRIYRNWFDSLMAQNQADCESAVYAYNIFSNIRNPSNYEYADKDVAWGIAMQSYNLTTARRQWIFNNIFYKNQSGGIKISGNSYASSYDSVTGNQIINNIFYKNGWDNTHETSLLHVNGTQIMNENYASPPNLGPQVIRYNLFITDYTANLFHNNGYTAGQYNKDFTYFNTNAGTDLGWTINSNVYGDPLFVNASLGDFTLGTNSPGINAGYNLSDYSLPNALMAGSTWPNVIVNGPQGTNWNIGAFVNAAGNPPLPVAPGSFIIKGKKIKVQ